MATGDPRIRINPDPLPKEYLEGFGVLAAITDTYYNPVNPGPGYEHVGSPGDEDTRAPVPTYILTPHKRDKCIGGMDKDLYFDPTATVEEVEFAIYRLVDILFDHRIFLPYDELRGPLRITADGRLIFAKDMTLDEAKKVVIILVDVMRARRLWR